MPIPRRVIVLLAIGLLAASQSGNLIRIGDAHPAAIAAWRLVMASMILAPSAGRDLLRLKNLSGMDRFLLVVAGLALSGHFILWIAAIQLTTVANAATFFAINPVFAALGAWFFFKESIGPRLFVSIGIGLVGVAIIGWSDFSFSPNHWLGDMVVLLSALLFTAYFLLGKRLRKVLPTACYVTVLYAVASIPAFLLLLFLDLPVFDWSARNWLCFVLMALVPTVIGHTSFNNALKFMDASRLSVVTLLEPLLAGMGAWLFWGEAFTSTTLMGYALICGSVLILLYGQIPLGRRVLAVKEMRGAP